MKLTWSKQIFPVGRRLSLFLRARIADDLWDGSSLSAARPKSANHINYKHTDQSWMSSQTSHIYHTTVITLQVQSRQSTN